jgi:hypothetical protein
MTFTCSDDGCTDSYTETIPAKGHTVVIDKYVAPTCTKAGKTEGSHCSVCGEVIVAQTTIPATGHHYLDEVTAEPTCEEPGERTWTCEYCGDTYTTPIPATGHDYKIMEKCNVEQDTNGNWVAKDCSDNDHYYELYCENCGDWKHIDVPKLEHQYTITRVTQPTYTSVGYDLHECSVCGDWYYTEVPKLVCTVDHTNTDNLTMISSTMVGKIGYTIRDENGNESYVTELPDGYVANIEEHHYNTIISYDMVESGYLTEEQYYALFNETQSLEYQFINDYMYDDNGKLLYFYYDLTELMYQHGWDADKTAYYYGFDVEDRTYENHTLKTGLVYEDGSPKPSENGVARAVEFVTDPNSPFYGMNENVISGHYRDGENNLRSMYMGWTYDIITYKCPECGEKFTINSDPYVLYGGFGRLYK